MHQIEKLRAFVHDVLPLDVVLDAESDDAESDDEEVQPEEFELPMSEEEPQRLEEDEGEDDDEPPKKRSKFPKIVFKDKGKGPGKAKKSKK